MKAKFKEIKEQRTYTNYYCVIPKIGNACSLMLEWIYQHEKDGNLNVQLKILEHNTENFKIVFYNCSITDMKTCIEYINLNS